MLPPIIPQSLLPLTAQHDPVKPLPEIPAVTPLQGSANESAVALDKRHPQEAEASQREEQQRRRQRRGYTAEELAAGEVAAEDQALLDELPRQGLWVDVEV